MADSLLGRNQDTWVGFGEGPPFRKRNQFMLEGYGSEADHADISGCGGR